MSLCLVILLAQSPSISLAVGEGASGDQDGLALPDDCDRHGWSALSLGPGKRTRLGALEPVVSGSAEVLISAVSTASGAAFLLLRLEDPIEANAHTLQALAASPDAFSRRWGAPFKVLWADQQFIRGRPALRIQGSFTLEDTERAALLTWVPHGAGHYLAVALSRREDSSTLPAIIDAAVARLPPDEEGGRGRGLANAVVAASVLGLALVAALVVRRSRRRPEDDAEIGS